MTYGVAETARLLKVSGTTIRRWSTWFADHLSDQASPAPEEPRRFTEADIATLRRAQRRLARGDTWELVAERLAILEPEELAEPEEAPAATAGPEEAEQERAQSTTASQALAILSQQSQIIEAQAGQLKAAQDQLTDQAARLREQAGQLTDQGATIADLRERLARLEEAQRAQQERRRFRWPWEPREG